MWGLKWRVHLWYLFDICSFGSFDPSLTTGNSTLHWPFVNDKGKVTNIDINNIITHLETPPPPKKKNTISLIYFKMCPCSPDKILKMIPWNMFYWVVFLFFPCVSQLVCQLPVPYEVVQLSLHIFKILQSSRYILLLGYCRPNF